MEAFLTALCKAPSYKGLQPWHCFIFENRENPEKKQLILCARTDLEDRIEQLVVEKDLPEKEEMEMLEYVASLSHRAHWSKHQLYLAFGYALASVHDSHIKWSEDFDVGSLHIPFYMIPTITVEWMITEQLPSAHTFLKSDLISTIHPGEHVGTFVPRMRYRHITPIHRRKIKKNED